MAFKSAGHDILWLDLLRSSGNREEDLRTIRTFFDRLRRYDLDANSAILLFDHDLNFQPPESAEVFGLDPDQLKRSIHNADLLLNFACSIRRPLLLMFRKRALLDGDPGHLQISCLQKAMRGPCSLDYGRSVGGPKIGGRC